VNEAYNLFNAVADQLYGPEVMQCSEKAPGDGGGDALPEEDNGEEEEDIDAAFEKVRWPISVFRIRFSLNVKDDQGVIDEPYLAKPAQRSSLAGPPGYMGWTRLKLM
jgi:hypothetical protein